MRFPSALARAIDFSGQSVNEVCEAARPRLNTTNEAPSTDVLAEELPIIANGNGASEESLLVLDDANLR
jgi:hypothetical protein